jgi:hypothetical protein
LNFHYVLFSENYVAMFALQVPLGDLVQGGTQSNEVLKKILAKVKLVRMGSIPLTELGRLKAYMLNSKSKG